MADASEKPKSNRGGKRAGAGRKRKDHVPAASIENIDVRAALDDDIPEQIETEAQRHAHAAVGELVKQIRFGKSDAQRVVACNSILDRGYGRPSVDTGVDMLPFLGKAPPKTSLGEIRVVARKFARLAITALEKIMTASDSEAARVAAAKSLLERGLGTVGVARMTAKDKAQTAPASQPREASSWNELGVH